MQVNIYFNHNLLKLLWLYIVVSIFYSCDNQWHKNQTLNQPILINSQIVDSNTIDTSTVLYINPIFPKCIGSFPPIDTIDINPEYKFTIYDSLYLNKMPGPYKSHLPNDSFEISIRPNQNMYYSKDELYLKDKYFPVFVQNISHSNRYWQLKDSDGFGFQEIFDSTTNTWNPLEHYPMGCGCCPSTWKVKPKYTLVFLFKKYEGSMAATARIRLNNNDSILTSSTYPIHINPTQTRLDTSSYNYKLLKHSEDSMFNYTKALFHYIPLDYQKWYQDHINPRP